jgi:hypothetical protein
MGLCTQPHPLSFCCVLRRRGDRDEEEDHTAQPFGQRLRQQISEAREKGRRLQPRDQDGKQRRRQQDWRGGGSSSAERPMPGVGSSGEGDVTAGGSGSGSGCGEGPRAFGSPLSPSGARRARTAGDMAFAASVIRSSATNSAGRQPGPSADIPSHRPPLSRPVVSGGGEGRRWVVPARPAVGQWGGEREVASAGGPPPPSNIFAGYQLGAGARGGSGVVGVSARRATGGVGMGAAARPAAQLSRAPGKLQQRGRQLVSMARGEEHLGGGGNAGTARHLNRDGGNAGTARHLNRDGGSPKPLRRPEGPQACSGGAEAVPFASLLPPSFPREQYQPLSKQQVKGERRRICTTNIRPSLLPSLSPSHTHLCTPNTSPLTRTTPTLGAPPPNFPTGV